MDRFAEIWPLFPETVRRGLLVGSEGKIHLMHLAQELLLGAQSKPATLQRILLNYGLDMLQAGWTKDPLDGQLAGQLLALDDKWPRLDQRTKSIVREVVARWQQPEDMRYYRRLAESRDSEKLRRFLLSQLGKEKGNLYWWQQIVSLGMYEQDQDLLGSMLKLDWSGLEPCRKLLAGDVAWLAGQKDAACGAYSRALGHDALFRRVWNFLESGRLDEGRVLLKEAFEAAPWLVSEQLRLFDVVQGTASRQEKLSGQVAIALYSYNKARELDATLASLLASDIGDNPIWVLDNGSSDGTADVLDVWQERTGGRLRRIDLHVNIGAPAARNWLMSMPEIRACSWMAYLDDDVELPGDWLQKFGAAIQTYPDAGVWGCKVVDHAQSTVMQSVDLHLLPPIADVDKQMERRFKVSDLHHQTLDFGQFNYMRPCASVTGCCHLFRMDRLQEISGFDLRFSPSQYDDLEHDVRLNLNGQFAVYQGFLTIQHKKRTGKATQNNSSEFGNALANMHKLQKKYSAAEYEDIMARESEILLRDFMKKRDAVLHWLHEGDA